MVWCLAPSLWWTIQGLGHLLPTHAPLLVLERSILHPFAPPLSLPSSFNPFLPPQDSPFELPRLPVAHLVVEPRLTPPIAARMICLHNARRLPRDGPPSKRQLRQGLPARPSGHQLLPGVRAGEAQGGALGGLWHRDAPRQGVGRGTVHHLVVLYFLDLEGIRFLAGNCGSCRGGGWKIVPYWICYAPFISSLSVGACFVAYIY